MKTSLILIRLSLFRFIKDETYNFDAMKRCKKFNNHGETFSSSIVAARTLKVVIGNIKLISQYSEFSHNKKDKYKLFQVTK